MKNCMIALVVLLALAQVEQTLASCFADGVACRGCPGVSGPNGMAAFSAQECQCLCAEHPECEFFVYRNDTNTCWMKTKNLNRKKTKDAEATFGPKYCPPQDCFTIDTKFPGFPVPGINPAYENITSALECQHKCLCWPNDECKFFTFSSAISEGNPNTCWLKTDKGKEQQTVGKISGPKLCPA